MGTGTVDVKVTTPGGISAMSSADQFNYVAAPTVTGVSPAAGPLTGSTLVEISGTNLTGATAVKFGSIAGTIVDDTDPSFMLAYSPPVAAGTVDVTVTTRAARRSHRRPTNSRTPRHRLFPRYPRRPALLLGERR